MMRLRRVLDNLRSQDFYRGQILEVREEPGLPHQSVPTSVFLENNERFAGGSLEVLLAVLGHESLHSSLAAALGRCFPAMDAAEKNEDSVLCARISRTRELFWQIAALLDALDEGRFSLVLCPDDRTAKKCFRALEHLIEQAEVGYAVDIRLMDDKLELGGLESRPPHLTVLSAGALDRLLHHSSASDFFEILVSGLGRLFVPSIDDWKPAVASHTAILLRELHLACLSRGVDLALAATANSSPGIENFVTCFWGKPISGDAFVKIDSVEAVPITWINYTGAMIRDPANTERWIRQPLAEANHHLLKWLVGSDESEMKRNENVELHYVVDVSGSMDGAPLSAVKKAITNDLTRKLDQSLIKEGDQIKITAFHTEADTIYSAAWEEAQRPDFTAAVESLRATGGTEVSSGISSALGQAVNSSSGTVKVILFSDGYSSVGREAKQMLLDMTRQIRSEGRNLEILYLMLDMSPPTEVKNLVTELGGILIEESASTITSASQGADWLDLQTALKGKYILFLSGEKGMPESVIQEHQGGMRKALFTRDTANLNIDPKEVAAVVVSGWFGGLTQIGGQVRHLGNRNLPVFLLTEAEASSQLIRNHYPETEQLTSLALAFPENRLVLRQRLSSAFRTGPIQASALAYLMDGSKAYDAMVDGFHNPVSEKKRAEQLEPIRLRFQSIFSESAFLEPSYNALHLKVAEGDTNPEGDTEFSTFSTDRVGYNGAGISGLQDFATSALVLHTGAIVDDPIRTARVAQVTPEGIELDTRDNDRCFPILENTEIRSELDDATAFSVERVGRFNMGAIGFQTEVTGIRRYPEGNLDGESRRESLDRPQSVSFETYALNWKPEACDSEAVLLGLANMLRLTIGTLVRYADQTCLIYPDWSNLSIWIIDLAPGGNGTARALFKQNDRFLDLLSLAGRLALDCPCEGGFAGGTDSKKEDKIDDTGCPRCTRTLGPIILPDESNQDLFYSGEKHATLVWLTKSKLLPDSAATHLDEKYNHGVTDERRFHGRDRGSRREIRSTARQIFRDRLGLELDDASVATFKFLPGDAPEGLLGVYKKSDNILAVREGLNEWWALDVYGHEFFHNLQFKLEGLIHPSLFEPNIPMNGLLFIEGSAVWAESHLVDALAIRTALDLANLRQGDEYGEGFQIMKWIEENLGGVRAVLSFLATGDIGNVSKGKVSSLDRLYIEVGVSLED